MPALLPQSLPEDSTTFKTTFFQSTASVLPVKTTEAPISAPISACEELTGIPRYHVNRFQIIAAISAAIIVYSSIAADISPPDIVLATFSLANAPSRFITAASATAFPADRAPV